MPIKQKIIFYSLSENSLLRIKEIALHCLTNLVKITFHYQSDYLMDVSQLVNDHRVMEAFVFYLGLYVDKELNQNILEALT